MKVKSCLLTLMIYSCSYYSSKKDNDNDINISSACSGVLKENDFQSGNGTSSSPYIICSKNQFFRINTSSTYAKHYKLGQNIDWSTDDEEYEEFTFEGDLNGDYKEISNLNVTLFSEISITGIVQYLELDDVEITSGSGSSITARNKGTIKNCAVSGSVSGGFTTGGIVATNEGTIEKSSFSGNITGDNNVGGIVGYNNSSTYSISDCYATNGNVTGNNFSGGIVGYNISGNIYRSYSTMKVFGVNNDPLIGQIFPGSCIGLFWDTEVSEMGSSVCGIGKNTYDMKRQSTYIDWDFENTWEIDEGDSYPTLKY